MLLPSLPSHGWRWAAALSFITAVSFWVYQSSFLPHIDHLPHLDHLPPPPPPPSDPLASGPSQKQYAFATLVAGHTDPKDRKSDEEDGYFQSVRLIVYQLLHSKSSAIDQSTTDVVVLSTQYTPESQRRQLIKDGAKVVDVDAIEGNGTHGEKRWELSLTRFHLWKMDYHKVCWMDADTFVVGNLNGVFLDPATEEYDTLDLESQTKEDEPPLPKTYIFAGKSGTKSNPHVWPPPVTNSINAGFMVFGPSPTLYDYYLDMLNHPDRASLRWLDQGILNYTHRRGGNMPWKLLHPVWNVNNPEKVDWDAGARSFHGKLWDAKGYASGDPFLRLKWREKRAEMEEFYKKRG